MTIKLKDNGEKLVDVKKYCAGAMIALGWRRMKREKTAYLRLTVAKMLRQAQQNLPPGMNFIINDAWRPAFAQAKIYFRFIKTFSKHYPNWSQKKVIREIEKYVAPWKGRGVSGHMTGGAIDLRLIDRSGRKIPMKSRKLSYQENALSAQKKLPSHIRKNRQILFTAMRKAGFSNYPKEYWHWSYGDYYWAKRNNKAAAFYCPVEDTRHLYKNESCPCGSGKKYNKCHGA